MFYLSKHIEGWTQQHTHTDQPTRRTNSISVFVYLHTYNVFTQHSSCTKQDWRSLLTTNSNPDGIKPIEAPSYRHTSVEGASRENKKYPILFAFQFNSICQQMKKKKRKKAWEEWRIISKYYLRDSSDFGIFQCFQSKFVEPLNGKFIIR